MQEILQTRSKIQFVWMFGKHFDIAFFYAPIALAVLLFLLTKSSPFAESALLSLLLIQAFGIGPFHQGLTWFHFFDRRTREHYLSTFSGVLRSVIVPLVILALSVVGMVYMPKFVYATFVIWTIQHITQQNVGLLLLYHNHGVGEAVPDRDLEVRSQHAAAVFFSFVFLNRLVPHDHFIGIIWSIFAGAALLVGLYSGVRYLGDLLEKVRDGAYLNGSALAFWALSMSFFIPFANIGTDYVSALMIPLMVHWFQYIGLNYVLMRGKYSASQSSDQLPIRRPGLLFAAAGVAMMVFVFGTRLFDIAHFDVPYWQQQTVFGIAMAMGLIHYWQDAFMWRFREQFNRDNLLQYLLAEKQAAQ